MARIGLVRIDSRLIHGQVCTQWLYRMNSKKVYIVDDEGASNSFLSSIYKMACPVGVELETISTQEAGNRWQQDQLGSWSQSLCCLKICRWPIRLIKQAFAMKPYR